MYVYGNIQIANIKSGMKHFFKRHSTTKKMVHNREEVSTEAQSVNEARWLKKGGFVLAYYRERNIWHYMVMLLSNVGWRRHPILVSYQHSPQCHACSLAGCNKLLTSHS